MTDFFSAVNSIVNKVIPAGTHFGNVSNDDSSGCPVTFDNTKSTTSSFFDLVFYLIQTVVGFVLVQQIVPNSDQYKNVKIIMYILILLGGYPVFFLIILWLFKLKIN